MRVGWTQESSKEGCELLGCVHRASKATVRKRSAIETAHSSHSLRKTQAIEKAVSEQRGVRTSEKGWELLGVVHRASDRSQEPSPGEETGHRNGPFARRAETGWELLGFVDRASSGRHSPSKRPRSCHSPLPAKGGLSLPADTLRLWATLGAALGSAPGPALRAHAAREQRRCAAPVASPRRSHGSSASVVLCLCGPLLLWPPAGAASPRARAAPPGARAP